MRIFLILSLYILALCGCQNNPSHKEKSNTAPSMRVAIQPLNDVDPTTVNSLQKALCTFFKCPVDILVTKSIPHAYLNTDKGERYSADSLLHFLALHKTDGITNVIGITGKDIFTTMREKDGSIKSPSYKYAFWGIFGYGAQPGQACILSTYRLHHTDTAIYLHRIRSVAIHELGHNLGLPHCNTLHCIMEAGKEKVSTVDGGWEDFCAACKKKLGR